MGLKRLTINKMTVKHFRRNKIRLRTLKKFRLLPIYAYDICEVCHIRFGLLDIPCEIEYRSKTHTACTKTIAMCEQCFSPNQVFTCDEHRQSVNAVECEFTGQGYEDSPVYYMFPDLGIRRVRDAVCSKCAKEYQVCHIHQHNSPIKYEMCAWCLRHTFWDPRWVRGVRERAVQLGEDEQFKL